MLFKYNAMGKEPKILIADTDLINTAYLKLMFLRKGFKSDTANSGASALKKIKEGSYDLVLIDSRLADNILSIIKPMLGNTPIVGIANTSLKGECKKMLEEGADYCVEKPVYMNKLEGILNSYLGGTGFYVACAGLLAAGSFSDSLLLLTQ